MRFTVGVPGSDADAPLARLLAREPAAVVELVHRLRTVVREAHPDLQEKVNLGWHGVAYHHPRAGYVCALFPRHGGVNVGFEHGADHPDPLGRLVGTGRTRDVRVEAGARPEEDDVIVDYLDLAVDQALDRAADQRRRRSAPRAD